MGTTITEIRREYHDVYLHSDHWKKVREAALGRAGYRCQVCNGARKLDVHHRTYERLGHERNADLTVLCRKCHDLFHRSGQLTRAPTAKSKRSTDPAPHPSRPEKPPKKRAVLLNQRIEQVLPVLRHFGPLTTAQVASHANMKLGQAGTTLAVLQQRRIVSRVGKSSAAGWSLL